MADEAHDLVEGAGYAVANIDALGKGPGLRKVRRALGVTAFGVNAIEIPPGHETGFHHHEQQQELYFVHRGRVEMPLRGDPSGPTPRGGDGSVHELGPGGVARVDPSTPRTLRNAGDEPAVYFVIGGKDGYVGRDAHLPEGESRYGLSGG